jgi:anion-transporting  ArsA/GET3 family ATPase
MLGKAWYHTTEKRPDGGYRFDVVLFDAPSTGQGLDMLRVPRVILDIVPPGILRRDAERAWQMLSDPAQSGVVVVSLAGDMPTTESLQLVDALRTELKLPIACTVINGVLSRLFSPSQREALLADEARLAPGAFEAEGEAQATLAAAVARAERERSQARNIDRLCAAMSEPEIILPRLFEGAGTPAGTAQLARVLNGEADG